ncbi:MAG: hypothetical protein P8X66_01890 [Maritimibacter sp.]
MAHKDKRGNTASFIKLDTWIFERPAYRRLGLGARCLHMELIRVYNGYNNGRLFLSHRLAADRLGCSRNTVSRYYRELEEARRDRPSHPLGADPSRRRRQARDPRLQIVEPRLILGHPMSRFLRRVAQNASRGDIRKHGNCAIETGASPAQKLRHMYILPYQ